MGAAYVGVILSARGPRALTVEAAADVLGMRGSARAVGVFVDEPVAHVARLARLLALDVVQLHGREDASFVAELRAQTDAAVWKALRVRDPAEAAAAAAVFGPLVDGILLDGFMEGTEGGAGVRFDWAAVADVRAALAAGTLLVVAGGLTPDNVADAVAALRPDVVDVSSGVESRVCRKSEARMRAFIDAARTTAGRSGS